MFTSRMEKVRTEAEAQGATVDWRREQGDDGIIYYTVRASGQGYALLNQLVFDNSAMIEPTIFNGKDAVGFQYRADSDLESYRMSLHAGEILQSDGVQEGKGAVTWEGAGVQVNAILRPKGSFPLLPLLGGLAAIVLLATAIFIYQAWRRQHARLPAVTSTYPVMPSSQSLSSKAAGMVFCQRCGKKIDVPGKFCPHCGASRA